MKRVVLVGGGHRHMALLAEHRRFADAGIAVTLIDPGRFWRGNHVSALMAGRVTPDALRASLGRRCRDVRFDYAGTRAIGLDARHQRVWVAGGAMHRYDAVSIDVGLEPDLDGLDDRGVRVQVWPAHSVAALAQCRDALDHAPTGRPPRVAVCGADARAVEVAAGLSRAPRRLSVALYVPGPRLLPEAPRRAVRALVRELARRGVDVVMDTAISTLAEAAVLSSDGRAFGADHLVTSHRERGSRFIHAGGLPTQAGRLCVNARLHSTVDDRVFAAGGCARLPGGQVPAPMDVACQARVLARNLQARLTRRPLGHYRAGPERGLIDLADGTALGWWGRFWWRGRWLADYKHALDGRLDARLAETAQAQGGAGIADR